MLKSIAMPLSAKSTQCSRILNFLTLHDSLPALRWCVDVVAHLHNAFYQIGYESTKRSHFFRKALLAIKSLVPNSERFIDKRPDSRRRRSDCKVFHSLRQSCGIAQIASTLHKCNFSAHFLITAGNEFAQIAIIHHLSPRVCFAKT